MEPSCLKAIGLTGTEKLDDRAWTSFVGSEGRVLFKVLGKIGWFSVSPFGSWTSLLLLYSKPAMSDAVKPN